MSAPDPQKLGEFEILEKLGHGGMGAVYKARQSSLGRLVALKVLPGNMANDDEFIVRFKAEARSAAALNHPGIVQVYAAGEDGGVHYFAMEYVDGESLQGRLQRKGRIAPLEALAICTHVATALHHGWKRAQIIHRDIKPDNIFLSRDGEVKLGDLGLAKSLGSEGSHLTQTGTSMGTPFYVSPEQAHGDKAVDFRADIYSLGCTLFHLLSGQTPYTASSPMAVMIKHITQPPPDIFAVWPDCPSALGPLLSRMLAKDPAQRHQSYEELIRDMMEVHEDIKHARPGQHTTRKVPATDSLPPAGRPQAAVRPQNGPAKKRPLLMPSAALGGAAVLAITTLLLWAPWKKKPAPAPQVTASPTPSTALARHETAKNSTPSMPVPVPAATPTPTATPSPATPPPPSPPAATPIPSTPAPATSPSTSIPASLSSRLHPGGGIVFQGTSGAGFGKHIVLLAGDEEYRSEEMLPQLAKILAAHHGFKCTVLFSTNPQTGEIDPNDVRNMPGLEALATADLCILMLRFRNWPDAQMKYFADYYLAGKPFIALRTSTHAFSGLPPTSPYAAFNYNAANWPGGFGRQVLGETWTSHWGQHKAQATRAIPVEPAASTEPILRGVSTFIGPTDVYEAAPPPDAKILLRGQVLSSMTEIGGAASGRKKRLNGQEQGLNEPMMPIAWTREVRNGAGRINRIFTCTMGTAAEMQELSFRRLLVNATYWTLGLGIPENNKATIVGEYRSRDYGFNAFAQGLKASNYLLPGSPTSISPPSTPVPVGGRIMLFDGRDTSAWVRDDGKPFDWPIVGGALEVGSFSIATKEKYQDFQLHAEFWIPRYPSDVTGQARGNSGVYLQRRYEIQILDTPGSNPGLTDCGAIYKQRAPDRNANSGPESWQSFDITFRAARFDAANRKTANARVTVIQNGITIHSNVEIPAATGMGSPEGRDPGPILLQSNVGRGVRFRNVWILPQ